MTNVFKVLSDPELVYIIKSGNADAYEELVFRYKNAVYGIAYGITSRHHDAEDIAQETFIDGYVLISRLKEPEKFMQWICGIAKRKALNHATRRKSHVDIDELSGVLFAPAASPEDKFIRKERILEIRTAVSRLSEKNRSVAMLFYFENKSIADIASMLDLSEGTVKSRLFEARTKLKGELIYMNENRHEPSIGFEAAIKDKINALRIYYKENGEGKDYKSLYSDTEKEILSLSESRMKNSLLADLYLWKFWTDGNEETKNKLLEAAKKSNDSATIAEIIIDEILNHGSDEDVLKNIDEKAIPELRGINGNEGIGMVLFWRGVMNIRLKRHKEAIKDFKTSAELCPAHNIYNTLSVSALKVNEKLTENTDDALVGFDVTAESYSISGTKLMFISQPGNSGNGVMWGKHKRDYLTYYISRFKNIFYDTAMEIGKTYYSDDGKSEMALMGFGETVTVIAGNFESCMHIHMAQKGEYDADIWYAENIGLIKAVFKEEKSEETEEYSLSEYEIHGGNGYFPFALGNRWAYVNPCLPDYLYQCFENEIIWTDGKNANLSTIRLVSFKKNYLTDFPLDSDIYIQQATDACEDWKLDEAVMFLQKALCENSSQYAAETALGGIEYLKRFAEYQSKGYRFCPSSYHASLLTQNDGFISYDEGGLYCFGPYRWGSRFEENRIFGVKPFRYLQLLMDRIWDDRWTPGYSEKSKNSDPYDADITLEVTDGGTIEVKAGTFTDCIKVTLVSERRSDFEENYYFDNYRNTWCGKKEFWYAKGVGIVKFDFTWGTCLKSCSELISYKNPAEIDSYMPLSLGSAWEYDETNLTAEGYRAKRIIDVACGMNGRYMIHDIQEFIYLGTEEEYESFKASL